MKYVKVTQTAVETAYLTREFVIAVPDYVTLDELKRSNTAPGSVDWQQSGETSTVKIENTTFKVLDHVPPASEIAWRKDG